MTVEVAINGRDMNVSPKLREYVEKKVGRLDHYLSHITEARVEARKLLAEVGVPDGFEFNLLNRNIQMPYSFVGIFLIDQWRQVGLRVNHVVK